MNATDSKIHRFGSFHVDISRRALQTSGGESLDLPPRAFDTLVYLIEHPGRLLEKTEIMRAVWPNVFVEENNLNQAISAIRRALGDSADKPRYIVTVPGRGYQFVEAVTSHFVSADPTISTAPDDRAVERRHTVRYVAAGAVVLIVAAVALGLRHESAPAIGKVASRAGGTELNARTLAVLPLRATAADETNLLLAQGVTDLIHNRLAALKDLTVIASSSTADVSVSHADTARAGARLNAGILLKGTVDRTGERLRLDLQLVDAHSSKQLWSQTFDRPLVEIAAVREQILQSLAGILGVAVEPATGASASINLDAYQLYVRGQRLMANREVVQAERAAEFFRRATILDPGFARAFLGLGQAQALQAELGSPRRPELLAHATKAFDRALELNPALGEAWIERAARAADPVDAEALYRKGLELAPNYGIGYLRYADFLWRETRMGEAIETIDRARKIDPLTPELYLRQAFFVMVLRSDVSEHDRLVRAALAINPESQGALIQLAHSRWEYSGEFADAAHLAERSLALSAQSLPGRTIAANIYLDLGDPVAAAVVLGDSPPAAAMVELAQYEGDRQRAASFLKELRPESRQDAGPQASMAQAIRDDAIATGDLGAAVQLLEPVYAMGANEPPMWRRALAIVYAHTLVLAGEVDRGRHLAQSMLVLFGHSQRRAGRTLVVTRACRRIRGAGRR